MTDKAASDATLEKLMRDLEIAGRNVSTPDVLAARTALREYLSAQIDEAKREGFRHCERSYFND